MVARQSGRRVHQPDGRLRAVRRRVEHYRRRIAEGDRRAAGIKVERGDELVCLHRSVDVHEHETVRLQADLGILDFLRSCNEIVFN